MTKSEICESMRVKSVLICAALLISVRLLIPAAFAAPDGNFTASQVSATAPTIWTPRMSQSSVAMPDGSIVLMGGYTFGSTTDGDVNDVWQSTNDGALWTELTANAGWSARVDHSSVVTTDGSIVLMGGYGIHDDYLNDVWKSTDDGATWTEMTSNAAWPGRYSFSSVAMPDGSIVVMGGVGYNAVVFNDVWRSTDDGATWTEMTPGAGWSARCSQSSVVMPDGSIVLMGGTSYQGDNPVYRNDVWRSTDDGATWTEITANAGWSGRANFGAVTMQDGSILVMGGSPPNNAGLNDVWRSTDNGATWTEMTTAASWTPRSDFSSVAMADGSVVLMGGWVSTGNPLNDVWRSTNDGAVWSEMTQGPLWTARWDHSSVAMPDGSIVLMGGNNYDLSTTSSGDMNDVWTSADNGVSWTELTADAGWKIRSCQNSVVMPDGSIVLMGGYEKSVPKSVNDVWRSTNNGISWTQMTSSAGWSERNSQSSVVMPDGSIVLMGGGYTSNTKNTDFNDVWQSTNDGALWTELTPNAGWSARWGQSSVVMPDGSIVLMGGCNVEGAIMNDVWRSTNNGASWIEMTTNAGWSARCSQNSVVMPDGSIVLIGGWNPNGLGPTMNDVWRSTDNGATWTEVTPNAEWSARIGQSAVVMTDGSIILTGGMDNNGFKNDVWRSTDYGATWTQQVPGPIYPDIGTIAGMQLATAANGDWQNSSATVMVDAGDTNPSLAVLTLGNPGQVPSISTHLVNLYPGQNGVVNSLLLPAQQNGLTSGPFPYTNAGLKGLRAVQVDNLIYAFYTLDSNDLAVCTISISEGNVVNVLNTQKVTYGSQGNQMSTFNVQASDSGIYLVSKQPGSQGSPVLDISLIPIGQLGSAGASVITPQPVVQFQNSATFNPVPDNFLYNTLLANDPTTGDPMIVGASDYQGQAYSWYIDLSNPGTYGQAPMPITGPLPGSISLSQGSTSYNPTGVNNLIAVAFAPTGSPESWGGIYTIGLAGMGQAGSGWNTLYRQGTLGHPYFGSPGLSGNNPMVFVPQGNGNMVQNMMFTAVQQAGGTATAWCSILGSNTLVPDPTPGNFDTQDNFNTYGNLSIPVGIVDGVPPIALNGYPANNFPVNSEVDLISQGTSTTESSGSTDASGTVKYGNNFLDDKIGIGASYTYGAKKSTVNGTVFSATITRQFPLDTQDWENSSSAWMVYLAPDFETQHFWIYDYNGNPPAAGDAMNIYVTYPVQGNPYSSLLQGYSITDPPTTGPLGSAMQSPFYNNFSQWDWSSWSGGWMDRDWNQYTGSNSYTVTPIMGGNPLDFSNGASQSGTFDMTTNAGNTHESSNTVDADASIFGFGASGNVALTQDQTVSNSIDKGIQFIWVLEDTGTGYLRLFLGNRGTGGHHREPRVLDAAPLGAACLPELPAVAHHLQPPVIRSRPLPAERPRDWHRVRLSA